MQADSRLLRGELEWRYGRTSLALRSPTKGSIPDAKSGLIDCWVPIANNRAVRRPDSFGRADQRLPTTCMAGRSLRRVRALYGHALSIFTLAKREP